MNNVVTSREEILKKSREIIRDKGFAGLSIRSVANGCNVSVGSIYNYFESKADLTESAFDSIWFEIFDVREGHIFLKDTEECVSWIFERMEYGCKEYPGFFTLHSLAFMKDKDRGREKMERTWQHILSGLAIVMEKDPKLRINAFNDEFTPDKFANVVFSLMLAALMREDYDSSAILEVVRRTLY